MLKAVLFDIDNTLILFDEQDFFKQYLGRLAPKFADLFPADDFLRRLIGASQTLLLNQGRKINSEHYFDDFTRGFSDHRGEIWGRFLNFYEKEFDALSAFVTPLEGVPLVVHELQRMNLKLVAASHPLWPDRVQKIRLRWASLDPAHFHHVTHIENTTFCKPQLGYYQEICDALSVQPEECLMVGNDLINDMVAGKLGMKTFLTTDAEETGFVSFAMSRELRNRHDETIPDPDFRGSLRALPDAVRQLMV